jgi:DNA-binding FadR family transcriptional regulator
VRARIIVALRLGTLRPGDRIRSVHVVAAGLDASEITTRRALESLVRDGALVRRRGAGGGTFVADAPVIPQDDAVDALTAAGATARQLVDTRVLLESALAGFAAAAASDADLERMRAAVRAGEAADDWAEFHAADREFHRAVAEASGVAHLESYFASLEALYAYFIPYPIEHLHGSNDSHRRIVDAIAAGDRAAAADEARAHVEALYDEMFFAL